MYVDEFNSIALLPIGYRTAMSPQCTRMSTGIICGLFSDASHMIPSAIIWWGSLQLGAEYRFPYYTVKMPTVLLLIFKPATIFPKCTAHWGLFLPNEEGRSDGFLYHVKKSNLSLVSSHTQFNQDPFDILQQANLIHSLLRLYELNAVTHIELANACHEETTNRRFNLVTSNCQQWVCQVLENLNNQFNNGQNGDVLDRVKGEGFWPLNGYVRSTTS